MVQLLLALERFILLKVALVEVVIVNSLYSQDQESFKVILCLVGAENV